MFLGNNYVKYFFLSLILIKYDIFVFLKYILLILCWYYLIVLIGSYKMKKVDCKEEIIESFLRKESDEKRRCFLIKCFEEFKILWNEL